jgi:hypothetical protein
MHIAVHPPPGLIPYAAAETAETVFVIVSLIPRKLLQTVQQIVIPTAVKSIAVKGMKPARTIKARSSNHANVMQAGRTASNIKPAAIRKTIVPRIQASYVHLFQV